ncbi:MAG: FmdB family zinc ribbon protein [Anaerolineae bacterium]
MPIYEYRCAQCNAVFQRLFRSLKEVEDTEVRCPTCGAEEVRRLFSAPAVHMAGATPAPEEPREEPRIKQAFGRKELQEALRSRPY